MTVKYTIHITVMYLISEVVPLDHPESSELSGTNSKSESDKKEEKESNGRIEKLSDKSEQGRI